MPQWRIQIFQFDPGTPDEIMTPPNIGGIMLSVTQGSRIYL